MAKWSKKTDLMWEKTLRKGVTRLSFLDCFGSRQTSVMNSWSEFIPQSCFQFQYLFNLLTFNLTSRRSSLWTYWKLNWMQNIESRGFELLSLDSHSRFQFFFSTLCFYTGVYTSSNARNHRCWINTLVN